MFLQHYLSQPCDTKKLQRKIKQQKLKVEDHKLACHFLIFINYFTIPEVAYGIPAISVVGNGFCAPYPLEFTIKKKYVGFINARYQVLDVNGNLLLQVDGSIRNCQKKRIMCDAAGFPILTMRERAYTMLHRWTIHRGETSDMNDLLFSMQKSNLFQIKSRFDIFLANNITGDFSNFQVVGSCSSLSAKVYRGDSMIAEAKHSFTCGSIYKGRDNIRVKSKSECGLCLYRRPHHHPH